MTDLGPALVQFSLMSSVLVGDIVYIGSRNILPARIIAFHLPTRKVIARTDLTTGYAIQAMAVDPTGRYLYAGVLQKSGGPQANLHRWDLADLPSRPSPSGGLPTVTCGTWPWHPTASCSPSAVAARRRPRSGSTTRPRGS